MHGDDLDDDDFDDHDESDEREERTFSFRQRLNRGLTGLLDPDGALGKSRDYVADLAQGTKSEAVRMVSREVRTFLDNMDTVDLLQQVIEGLVIDVNASIRFSFEDKNGKRELKPKIVAKDTKIRSKPARKNGKNGKVDGADKEQAEE